VTPGADVYTHDVYERPTSQTYTGSTPVASEYLGYLALTTAKYGYNDQYMFFQLKLFSPYLYKNDGTVDTGVFGSGTYYGVQWGSANGNDGQLLLRTEQSKDTLGVTSFNSLKTQGWYGDAAAAAAIHDTEANAAPTPASPIPAGSASAQASGGYTTQMPNSTRAASARRPPPRKIDASVLVNQVASAPAPNIQTA